MFELIKGQNLIKTVIWMKVKYNSRTRAKSKQLKLNTKTLLLSTADATIHGGAYL